MNDLNIDYINDILSNSVISHKNLIGETLFVNSNPAKVESVEVKKVNNVIATSKKVNDYKLDSTTTEISNIDKSNLMFSISQLLDNKFIKLDKIDISSNSYIDQSIELYQIILSDINNNITITKNMFTDQ